MQRFSAWKYWFVIFQKGFKNRICYFELFRSWQDPLIVIKKLGNFISNRNITNSEKSWNITTLLILFPNSSPFFCEVSSAVTYKIWRRHMDFIKTLYNFKTHSKQILKRQECINHSSFRSIYSDNVRVNIFKQRVEWRVALSCKNHTS